MRRRLQSVLFVVTVAHCATACHHAADGESAPDEQADDLALDAAMWLSEHVQGVPVAVTGRASEAAMAAGLNLLCPGGRTLIGSAVELQDLEETCGVRHVLLADDRSGLDLAEVVDLERWVMIYWSEDGVVLSADPDEHTELGYRTLDPRDEIGAIEAATARARIDESFEALEAIRVELVRAARLHRQSVQIQLALVAHYHERGAEAFPARDQSWRAVVRQAPDDPRVLQLRERLGLE